MLIPAESVLVFMTSDSAPPTPQAFESISQRLLSAANLAGVPVIRSVYLTRSGSEPSIHTTQVRHDALTFPFVPEPKQWAASALGAALATVSRNRVIVIGHWLEDAITLLALNCLSTGLDPYVPSDLTPVLTSANEPAARARLSQAGAVPTSSEQIIREWAALHDDQSRAKQLLDTLAGSTVHS